MPKTKVLIETEQISARVPKTLVIRMENYARERGITVSQVIRQSVEGTLNQWEERKQQRGH
jgi:hypothetical protein